MDPGAIKFIDHRNHVDVTYFDKPIILQTPEFKAPFGIEEKFDKFFINLFMDDTIESQELYHFIKGLEQMFSDQFSQLKNSAIRESAKYKPILQLLIPEKNKQFQCDIEEKNGTPLTVYNLKKGDLLKCTLLIDSMWCFKGKYSYKIKVKKMIRMR
jgi:hypothetical protein